MAGQWQPAVKQYRFALEVLREGLAVQLHSAGLGADHSNTSRWRADMHQWQQQVLRRLESLEGSAASPSGRGASAAVGGGGGGSSSRAVTAPRPAPVRPIMRPGAYAGGASPAAAPPPPPQLPAGGSKEDQDFDSRVLSEVLDKAPAIAWDDVAGLGAAKQV